MLSSANKLKLVTSESIEDFLLTFGPVIRKLFTDLEERENRAQWRDSSLFLLLRVTEIISTISLREGKGN